MRSMTQLDLQKSDNSAGGRAGVAHFLALGADCLNLRDLKIRWECQALMAAHAPDRLRRGRAGARHRGGENRLKSG
jgi:hypothetical protein